jgi:ADP-heptose:LPS heptosyltransferase
VAVQVGSHVRLHAYPDDLIAQLARSLADEGVEVVLFGDQPAFQLDDADPRIRNLCACTPDVADLAATLRQMDVVITSDSFPMHLAGALGITTLAVFTATDPVAASDYARVAALPSRAECSPCRHRGPNCPLGYGECAAHRDPSVKPSTIVERVLALMAATAA